jgi:hypothetical protein
MQFLQVSIHALRCSLFFGLFKYVAHASEQLLQASTQLLQIWVQRVQLSAQVALAFAHLTVFLIHLLIFAVRIFLCLLHLSHLYCFAVLVPFVSHLSPPANAPANKKLAPNTNAKILELFITWSPYFLLIKPTLLLNLD